MTPQRRIALVSVFAAAVLIALKLVTGLATGSLGLMSDALHSGTDLIAALLTLFAVGFAGRPADAGHPYGHGKAEHLAALAEAAFLVAASLFIASRALSHLLGSTEPGVEAPWYALAVVVLVLVVDASRTVVSARGAKRYSSPALQANALHFASDLLSSAAVLVGLLLVRAGYADADSAAALFVAALVLFAAGRLMRRNMAVLMDQAPAGAHEAAASAIGRIRPPVELRRLRIRQAGGRHFADVVVGVSPGDAVGQGHAAADAVEAAVRRVVPGTDVVVHVEPAADEAALRERAHAAALGVPRVREVHNLTLVTVDGATELSLHLKLPGDLSLREAHEVSGHVEETIMAAVSEVTRVQTHLEPLGEVTAGRNLPETATARDTEIVLGIVQEMTGRPPRELRFLRTDQGVVAFLTLELEPDTSLAVAHARASEVEERIRARTPDITDVVVHTEP